MFKKISVKNNILTMIITNSIMYNWLDVGLKATILPLVLFFCGYIRVGLAILYSMFVLFGEYCGIHETKLYDILHKKIY